MSPYSVFIAAEVIVTLRPLKGREKRIITKLFDELADDPSRRGDFVDLLSTTKSAARFKF